MQNEKVERYPYLSVIIMFTGLGSFFGGLIIQLCLMIIFGKTSFQAIGYQPLLYVSIIGFIPALLTGVVIALKQIQHGDKKSKRTVFLTGFVISALYIGLAIIYLGIHSPEEIALLFSFMFIVGVFGGINAVIASLAALPKACITRFDKVSKKDDDIYQYFINLDDQQIE